MKCCISFGNIKIKLFLLLFFALAFLFIGKKSYPLYLDKKKEILSQYLSPEKITAKKISNENRLIKTFIKYIGFSLFLIFDKIRDKISFKGVVTRDCFLSPLIGKEYGKNGSPINIFTNKDKIYFILIAFAFLLNEIVSIYIKKYKIIKIEFLLMKDIFLLFLLLFILLLILFLKKGIISMNMFQLL